MCAYSCHLILVPAFVVLCHAVSCRWLQEPHDLFRDKVYDYRAVRPLSTVHVCSAKMPACCVGVSSF